MRSRVCSEPTGRGFEYDRLTASEDPARPELYQQCVQWGKVHHWTSATIVACPRYDGKVAVARWRK